MRANLSGPRAEDEDDFPEPPRLRLLRLTVMGLTVSLTLGVVVIVGTVAWRLWAAAPPAVPVSAEALALPAGQAITALGASASEILVSTRDEAGAERLLVFRRADGKRLSETPIRRED